MSAERDGPEGKPAEGPGGGSGREPGTGAARPDTGDAAGASSDAPFVSFAQNYEDLTLWRALGPLVERGFYVDVGAAHPDLDSVTRAFYDRGWSGVNVEADPDVAALLREARPRDVTLAVAAGAERGTLAFHRVPERQGWATGDAGTAAAHRAAGFRTEAIEVRVATVADICRVHAPADIHFLKVDVEGAEAAVLRGADLAAIRPWIVVVEATRPGTPEPNHQGWEPIVLEAGYVFAWFDGLNRFYVAAEREAALAPALARPPSFFDHFERAVDRDAVARVAARLAEVDAAWQAADAAVRAGEARAAGLVDDLGRQGAALEAAAADLAAARAAAAAEAAWLNGLLEAARGEAAALRPAAEAGARAEAVAVEAAARAEAMAAEVDRLAVAQREAVRERRAAIERTAAAEAERGLLERHAAAAEARAVAAEMRTAAAEATTGAGREHAAALAASAESARQAAGNERARAEAAEALVTAMRASSSWRLSAPVRAARRALGRCKQGGRRLFYLGARGAAAVPGLRPAVLAAGRAAPGPFGWVAARYEAYRTGLGGLPARAEAPAPPAPSPHAATLEALAAMAAPPLPASFGEAAGTVAEARPAPPAPPAMPPGMSVAETLAWRRLSAPAAS